MNAVPSIPDDLLDPSEFDPANLKPKPVHLNFSKITPPEVARMNKVSSAKILSFGDTRKAQTRCDYEETVFMKGQVPMRYTTKENCLFETYIFPTLILFIQMILGFNCCTTWLQVINSTPVKSTCI